MLRYVSAIFNALYAMRCWVHQSISDPLQTVILLDNYEWEISVLISNRPFMCTISEADLYTIGTSETVMIREVSLFQRLICILLGPQKLSSLEKCPYFRG